MDKPASDLPGDFPGFSRLYRISSQGFQVQLNVTHERAYALFLGHKPKDPLVGRWCYSKAKPKDVINNSYHTSFLVNEKVKGILEANHFTGFRTLPCEVYDRKREALPGYSFLQVTGRCGPIDESRRVLVQAQYPMGLFPVLRGAYFAEESWDQSDVFSAPNYSMVIVTERVKKALEAGKVSGVEFTSLDLMDRIPLSSDNQDPLAGVIKH